MKHAPGQLLEFVTGAPFAQVEDGLLVCHRLPPPMREIRGDKAGTVIRKYCPACVRLRFKTNSRHVSLALRYGDNARWYFQCSLVLDGETWLSFGPVNHVDRWEAALPIPADDEMHELDIWLPHFCIAKVESIELDDGASIEPADPLPVRWLAYGDSITQGMTATVPLLAWTARCAMKLGAEIVNTGVGGAMLDRRLSETDIEGPFDVVTILFGGNDMNNCVPLDEFEENARLLVGAVQSAHPETSILLITKLNSLREGTNDIGASQDDYRQCFRNIAPDFDNVRLVEGPNLIPADHNLFADKGHPNDSGNGVLAENLLPILKEAIGQ